MVVLVNQENVDTCIIHTPIPSDILLCKLTWKISSYTLIIWPLLAGQGVHNIYTGSTVVSDMSIATMHAYDTLL